MLKSNEYKDTRTKLHHAEADIKSELCDVGDRIAKANRWTQLNGMEAIHRFLIDKYHWLPHEVQRLSVEDLVMLLDGVKETKPRPKRRRIRLNEHIQ